LCLVLAVFYQDLTIIAVDALQSDFMSYMLTIPFIFAYLVYRRRKMIRATIIFESPTVPNNRLYRSEIIGALMLLAGFLLYTGGSYTLWSLEFHMAVLPIFAAAYITVFFNLRTLRQLAFPILFLLFLVPPPSDVTNALGQILSQASSDYASVILNALGFSTTISTDAGFPTITVLSEGAPLTFMVDPVCSGLYSLFGFLVFATFIVYIATGKSWKRATAFLIGFPLIYLLNVLRITTIVILGYYYGVGLAMTVFHFAGGWVLILAGTMLVLLVSEKLLKIQLFRRVSAISCSECKGTISTQSSFCGSCGRLLRYLPEFFRKGDLAKFLAMSTCVILLISVQTPVFALTKGPADILTVIESYPDPLAAEVEAVAIEMLPQSVELDFMNYTLRYEGHNPEWAAYAKQDAALDYIYMPTNGSYSDAIFVGIEIASARSNLHRLHVCTYLPPGTKEILLLENPPIFAAYYPFELRGMWIPTVEWFERATFSTNTTFQQKHVKFDVYTYPSPTDDLEEVEETLRGLAIAIAEYWQPLKSWSPSALFISQNGTRLSAIPLVALGLLACLSLVSWKQSQNANRKAYSKLSSLDQQIIDALRQTPQDILPTVKSIQLTFEKLSGKNIETEELTNRLNSIKELGLAKQEIVGKQDEPILAWTVQM
ncbi:MAG: exosortase/archaeosortase family protein, partial [Candidatus Bathyarchaeota archaeon]